MDGLDGFGDGRITEGCVCWVCGGGGGGLAAEAEAGHESDDRFGGLMDLWLWRRLIGGVFAWASLAGRCDMQTDLVDLCISGFRVPVRAD